MKNFGSQLRADAIQLGKTPFFILHLAIPALGILIFTLYQSISIIAPNRFAVNYYQVLTLIFPLIAAWLCSIVAEQEVEAGGGFNLLATPSRTKKLLSKLVYLLVCGLGACLLAVLGYGGAVVYMKPGFSLPLSTTLSMAVLVWGCAVFEYLFHTWLCLRFSRNASFAAAATEVLLAALMLTGLGERIWFFIPSAWGVRLVSLLASLLTAGDSTALPVMQTGLSIAAVVTLVMAALLFTWFFNWEGRKKEE